MADDQPELDVVESLARYRVELVRECPPPYGGPSKNLPTNLKEVARQVLAPFDREVLAVLFLNGEHRCIGHCICSMGTLSRTVVEPRGVFTAAILARAHRIAICHNHPSNHRIPTMEDFAVTTRVRMAGAVLQIDVIDHFIATDEDVISMREVGPW